MKFGKKVLSTVLVLAVSMSFVACNRSTNDNNHTSTPETNTEVDKGQSEASTNYPLTVTTYNYEGNEVDTVYEKAPERVLAVYQGSIETMLALGLEDRMVAAAGLDNEVDAVWQDAFSKVNYLDEFTPSKETAISLQPDMILSWGSLFSDKNLGDIDYWMSSGCNTYINSNTRRNEAARTLKNEFTDILNLGKIFDVEEKAEAIVDNMRSDIAKTQEIASQQETKKSVLVIEFLGDRITNYGATSLAGDMVTALGAELAAPEASTLGKEDIVALNPDEIFVVYMAYSGEDGEDVKTAQLNNILQDDAFASLKAVQEGNVHAIMLGDMYASGVRTQNGIATFAEGIYE